MKCKQYSTMASPYLDRELSFEEAGCYRAHLVDCAACRDHLAEVTEASLLLKRSIRPEPPSELRGYVMSTIEKRRSTPWNPGQTLRDWALKLNPIPISYAAGVAVSITLFALMLSALKPVQAIGWGEPVKDEVVFIHDKVTGGKSEFRIYNDLEPDRTVAENYYELPRLLNNSALVSFSHIAYRKPGPDGMAVLVEVASDGHARLVDVLEEPSEPYMIEQLWWSLSKRTFQPAFLDGHPVSTRIVLLVEKVDVRG